MSWVSALWENLEKLIPWVIIRPYERGVLFLFGRWVYRVGPGMWPRMPWPFTDLLDVVADSVMERPVEIESQSVTTKDGKAVCISTNLTYEVVDFKRFFCEVHDGHGSLRVECKAHVHQRVRELSLEDLLTQQGALETYSSRRGLVERAKDWGIKVKEVRITQLVLAKHFRLIGDDMRVGE